MTCCTGSNPAQGISKFKGEVKMIKAKEARENVNYYYSKERERNIEEERIQGYLQFLNNKIKEKSERGITSFEFNLRTEEPWNICIYDVNEVYEIEERLKKMGYTVETKIKDSNILSYSSLNLVHKQGAIKDTRIAEIRIEW